MFENFKLLFDSVNYAKELPDYAEYYDEDSEGVFVSVLTENLSSFNDWVVSKGIKVKMV